MKIFIDIGSTTIKIRDTKGKINIYKDRSPEEDILKKILSMLEDNNINLNNNQFSFSSSANGGVKVGIFSYSKSLSGLIAYDALSRAGCNIVFQSKFFNEINNIKDIEECDKIVITGGTNLEIDYRINRWANELIKSLKDVGFKSSNIVLSSLFKVNDKSIKKIKPLLDERLRSCSDDLLKYFSKIYLDDLCDKKKIIKVAKFFKINIRATPEVVHSGYEKIYLGKAKHYIGTDDSIWIDIGGATTDIYFPRISSTYQDGINILQKPTSRKVLVSVGFNHSKNSTLIHAKSSYWFRDFTEKYISNIKSSSDIDQIQNNTAYIVSICLLLVLIDCFQLGKINFNYKIKLDSIKKIIVTGGGPFYLKNINKNFLNSYIKNRLNKNIEIIYDVKYTCWTLGHEITTK